MITFQAQSVSPDAAVTPSPEDEIVQIQVRGLALLEIRILTANLPEDLLVKMNELFNSRGKSAPFEIENVSLSTFDVLFLG